MIPPPRWWTVTFRITLIILGISTAVFIWSALFIHFEWSSWTGDEWFELGSAIVSALTGLLMLAILAGLGIHRVVRTSRSDKSAKAG